MVKLPGTLALLAVLSPCAHVQLGPFYHLSTLDVTHMRKDTRPFAFLVQPKTVRAWEQGYLKSAKSMSSALEKLLVGTRWTVSLLCMNGLRKQSSHFVGPPFLVVKLIPSVDGLVASQEPYAH